MNADIRIRRDHALGLARARELAWQWAQQQARGGQPMAHRIEPGDAADVVHFSRAGIHGRLVIAADHLELTASLGLLMRAVRPLIEAEIGRNLDALLAGGARAPSEGRCYLSDSISST